MSETDFPYVRRRMKQVGIVIVLLSAIMLLGPGCESEPGMDKAKFAELNRAALDLQAAITSATPCDIPDTLLQRLVSGTTALKDRTTSQEERDLLGAYTNLVTTYKDGLLLCKYRNALTQFEFVPKGRIYVFQELDPLVQKYELSTQSHVYQPTGLHWRSIDGDSIQVIWKNVEFQIKIIQNMINYN